MLAVPLTLAPVPVTVNTELPAAATVTLPFAVAILTLLVPFARGPLILLAVKLPITVNAPLDVNAPLAVRPNDPIPPTLLSL